MAPSNRVPVASFIADVSQGCSPATVAAYTVVGAVTARTAYNLLHDGDVFRRGMKWSFAQGRKLFAPIIKNAVREAAKDITFPTGSAYESYSSIPEEGLSHDEVLAVSSHLITALDKDMSKDRLSGVVYIGTTGKTDTITAVVKQHLWSNPLFADYFGATRKIESEVVEMLVELFNGRTRDVPMEDRQVGCYTFGGTESVLMAMLAMRNYGLNVKGYANPNIIVGTSAHPAFNKAATYFGIRLIKVEPEPGTYALSAAEVERHITYETVGIVGSAPSFAHGTVDPIGELSDLAVRRGLLLHVDACLGGLVIQFMQKAGLEQPVIDFRHPGVTSISADIHKWGGSPKGASVVLYRGAWLRKHQTFAYADYPGGLYVTACVNGSKAGYVITAAWATLLTTGKRQYAENVRAVITAAKAFQMAVESLPILYIVGRPEVTTVAFSSKVLDVYTIKTKMDARGWILNPCQFPPAVHLGLTLEHTRPGAMAQVIRDLAEVVDEMAQELGFESAEAAQQAFDNGSLRVTQKHKSLVYGSTQSIPDRSIIEQVLCKYVDKYYVNPDADPVAAAAA